MTDPTKDQNAMSDVDWGPSLTEKENRLRGCIRDMGSTLVAFSAGVDSTLLAVLAHQELGEQALAVTATSPAFPQRELDEAVSLAKDLGFRHRIIESDELANPDYSNNPTNRCYHCKTELYGLLRHIATQESIACILDGTNVDDLGDYRPGKKAAEEQGVRSVFAECGLTKREIRQLSDALKLPTANKPAFACMASRFPYGLEITQDKLHQVEQAEEALRALGFRQLRVRVHDTLARIELQPEDLDRALEPAIRSQMDSALRACGYDHVCLDLRGYRQGSLNESLSLDASTFSTTNLGA